MSLLNALILTVLPISELRGGIPLAIVSGVNPLLAFGLLTIANALVMFPIFFFLDKLHVYFMRISFYKKLFNRYVERVRRKAEKRIERWGYFGLTIFVMIPLPVTGAYTGTLAAWVLGLERKKSYLAIAFGVVIAGVIMTLVSLGLFGLVNSL